MANASDFKVGDRVWIRSAERYPFFIVERCAGTVVEVYPGTPEACLCVRADEFVENCREWSNEIQFGAEWGLSGKPREFGPLDEVEPLRIDPASIADRLPEKIETKADVRAFIHAAFDLVGPEWSIENWQAFDHRPPLGIALANRFEWLRVQVWNWTGNRKIDPRKLAAKIARERRHPGA